VGLHLDYSGMLFPWDSQESESSSPSIVAFNILRRFFNSIVGKDPSSHQEESSTQHASENIKNGCIKLMKSPSPDAESISMIWWYIHTYIHLINNTYFTTEALLLPLHSHNFIQTSPITILHPQYDPPLSLTLLKLLQ